MVAAMRSEIRAAWCRMLHTLLVGLLLIMVVATAGVVLPGVESQLFPVLRAGLEKDGNPVIDPNTGQPVPSYKIVSMDDGALSFTITAEKLRPCTIDSMSWVLERDQDQNGVYEHNALTVYNRFGDIVGGHTGTAVFYDTGPVTAGPFFTIIPINLPPRSLILATVEYRCHPFWTTRSVLGRVPLS